MILTDQSLFQRVSVNDLERKELLGSFTVISNDASSANDLVKVYVDMDEDDYDNTTDGDTFIVDDGSYDIVGLSSYDDSTSPNTYIQISASGITEDQFVGTTTYSIRHNFKRLETMCPTYCSLPSESTEVSDRIFIADQADRGIYQYDTDNGLTVLEIDSSESTADEENYTNIITGRTITYFNDRVWIANTIEEDGEHKQRIRWSEVSDFDRFWFENYVDLPYTEGQCIALVPLGSLLIAYFEDAIYYGRQSQVYGLPLSWTRLETGNVGLIATGAVASYTDTHFFVGQDDVYLLSESLSLVPTECPVITESLDYTKDNFTAGTPYIQVEHDQLNDTMVFFYPDQYEEGLPINYVATRLWRFNYRTQTWSYDEVNYDDTKTTPRFLYTGIGPSKTYLYGRTWQDWLDLDDETYDEDTDSDMLSGNVVITLQSPPGTRSTITTRGMT